MANSEKPAAINGEKKDEEEEEKLVAVIDFDVLCSTVAMQTHQGKCKWSSKLDVDVDVDVEDDIEYGGGAVLRMWEGDLLDCLDDRRLALESACCPCYRFGKNMRRAGFGSCFIQGLVYFLIAVAAVVNVIAFLVTKRHCFLYLGVAFALSVGTYLGFYRTQIRKKFNIMGSDSSLDDCVYHLICSCCALSQESRTLEMNNVQDGIWHGRGDTICIGGYGEGSKAFFELRPPPLVSICCTNNSTNGNDHPWPSEVGQSAPLVQQSP